MKSIIMKDDVRERTVVTQCYLLISIRHFIETDGRNVFSFPSWMQEL